VSTVTPPDAATPPPAPPERRCPRCGSSLAPDQEWCLACGAAAETEVADPRGWRVPIMLTGGLGLLALIGVVLLIVALAGANKDKVAQVTPTPTPPAAAPPAVTPTPTASALPTVSPSATPGASDTPAPGSTPAPGATPTPSPSATPSTGSSSFPGWTGGDGWTIIVESASTQAKAESVATSAQSAGETVGILKSDDFSSLNAGYWVVFTGDYSSKKDAQAQLDAVRAKHADAYVRQIKR
jgi:predicted nucleic acid-binding Zn ribbon protein